MSVAHILARKGRKVVTLPPSTSVFDVAKFLSENQIGAIIIAGPAGKIEGIVSERDVVRVIAREGAEALSKPVSTIMTRAVKTCAESDSEAILMRMMTDNRVRHLPVVDEGKLTGIISIGDVVKHRIQALEHESEEMRAYISSAG